ncbi:ATP-binding region ATPase domain protein [Desulfurispirillum indicum S5]|uniref:histidine kinase n=1 Tax=Desulfurispirillum indicum (strain ATCC BAA-1389 / DSM 22839 / S5) TaxID=653733 RepID=E6W584_DESIS|nr:ATP-binding protein [Desulfurispirillum indicum]ADU67163.1 ATP-binding region ATPase domain protein [Desulfurispirillum indicum S5]
MVTAAPPHSPLSSPIPRASRYRRGNILVIGLLILLTLIYFSWQASHNTRTFSEHTAEQAQLLAEVLLLNTRTATTTGQLLSSTAHIFLSSTAEFIAYLNSIEPFTDDELTAFAQEAGLAGIRIASAAGPQQLVEGPRGWLGETIGEDEGFFHLREQKLFVLSRLSPQEDYRIQVGFDASALHLLEERSGLEAMLGSLGALPHMKRVEVMDSPPPGFSDQRDTGIQMLPRSREVVITLPLDGGKWLVVNQDADHYYDRVQRLWGEFVVFSALLILVGLLFAWLLSRMQQAHLATVQAAERQLAQQHEDATIGRATATISHEIKNPLNAISMGLQRLSMEVPQLEPEQQELLYSMRSAVERTSRIVSALREYAHPVQPRCQQIDPQQLVSSVLSLYRNGFTQQDITVEVDWQFTGSLSADPELLCQALENLVKNALEAAPHGGRLTVGLYRQEHHLVMILENSGYDGSSVHMDHLLEPYVTSKTQGSGLGLPIARRIVEAHGGQLFLESPQTGIFRVTVVLPAGGTCQQRSQL